MVNMILCTKEMTPPEWKCFKTEHSLRHGSGPW